MNLANQVYPVVWQSDHVVLIDQTRLPEEYDAVQIRRCDDMVEAIKTMIVRGAPAIGVAAAYGIYLGAREIHTSDRDGFLTQLEQIAQRLRATRPTAVNLFWAIDRMLKVARQTLGSVEHLQQTLLAAAQAINAEDIATCRAIGDHGFTLRCLWPLSFSASSGR